MSRAEECSIADIARSLSDGPCSDEGLGGFIQVVRNGNGVFQIASHGCRKRTLADISTFGDATPEAT